MYEITFTDLQHGTLVTRRVEIHLPRKVRTMDTDAAYEYVKDYLNSEYIVDVQEVLDISPAF